jgi:hypothetical protein
MHEDELRALIRDAVARHLGAASADGRAGSLGAEAVAKAAPSPASSWKAHLSHGRFVFLAPTEPDAPCVVEPQVRCHHCGFCQSYGH